jgi:hypothetical protein
MQANPIQMQKNIQSSKIIKLKSNKFAEAPPVRKLKDALLIKIQEKFPAVGDYLSCAANYEAPDQSVLDAINDNRHEVIAYVESIADRKRSLSQASRTQLREAVLDEIFGFGPLGILLRNPDVGNIYVEGATRVFVERFLAHGERRIEQVRLPFRDEGHVLDVINRIVLPLGLGKLNETNPIVSGRLPNGTAVYASVPPLSVHGPTLTLLCQELDYLDVLPEWRVSSKRGDHLPLFTNEGSPGEENFCLCVNMPVDSSSVGLYQRLSARSFRGKTIRFSGAIKAEELPADTDNELEISNHCLPYATIRAWAGRQNQQKCWNAKDDEEIVARAASDGWHHFSRALVVPQEALGLEIFLALRGGCISKVKDLSFEVVSKERKEVVGSRLRLPKNLSLRLGR